VLSRPFWLSLKPDELSALAVKVARDEKFASEIFYHETHTRLLRRNSGGRVGMLKHKQINGFLTTNLRSPRAIVVAKWKHQIKNL
jgi:hypothetical protein